MMAFSVIELKGGSLGDTKLYSSGNNHKFVRKSINFEIEREYGVVRWLSQYKRLQSYNSLFPNIFPKVLNFGIEKNCYFMDIEYFEGYVNVSDYLLVETDESKIAILVSNILDRSELMYSHIRFDSPKNAIQIYNEEEIHKKLLDAKFSKEFAKFSRHEIIKVNGVEVDSIDKNLSLIISEINKVTIPFESITHGNLTLENIMVHPITLDIRFIDPYEENIIDVLESDFSQILQSCASNYEVLNSAKISIQDNSLSYSVKFALGTQIFEKVFKDQIVKRFVVNNLLMEYLHFSQFVRMLPFKVKSNFPDKAILFYAVACKLLNELKDDYL